MDTVRWGFIGCGAVTEVKSGPAFSEVEGSQVVAVMSRTEEKARSYAQRHGIPRHYTDALALINDPEVNAVYIATPPSSHATFATMAMRAGKPVYIEKPMASNYDEAIRICRTAERTRVPCFVAFYRRQLPYFLRVQEIVQSGQLGKILTCHLRLAVPPKELDYAANDRAADQNGQGLPWRLQPDIAGGGGYFYDLAPHQIDLLQLLLGNIIEAQGYKANRAGLYSVEDCLSACLQFDSGIIGSAMWCFVAHESARTDRIQIIGQNGSVSFSVYDYKPISLYTSAGHQTFAFDNPPHVQEPLIRQVVAHLRGQGVCKSDANNGASVNWVMDKILGKFRID